MHKSISVWLQRPGSVQWKTQLLCCTFRLGCSEPFYQESIIAPIPVHWKQRGLLPKWRSSCVHFRVPCNHCSEVAWTKWPAWRCFIPPLGHHQRGNRKAMLISRSEGKLGVQINMGEFFTLNSDKSIKQKDSLSDDRKWIERCLLPSCWLTVRQERK